MSNDGLVYHIPSSDDLIPAFDFGKRDADLADTIYVVPLTYSSEDYNGNEGWVIGDRTDFDNSSLRGDGRLMFHDLVEHNPNYPHLGGEVAAFGGLLTGRVYTLEFSYELVDLLRNAISRGQEWWIPDPPSTRHMNFSVVGEECFFRESLDKFAEKMMHHIRSSKDEYGGEHLAIARLTKKKILGWLKVGAAELIYKYHRAYPSLDLVYKEGNKTMVNIHYVRNLHSHLESRFEGYFKNIHPHFVEKNRDADLVLLYTLNGYVKIINPLMEDSDETEECEVCGCKGIHALYPEEEGCCICKEIATQHS